MKRFVVVSLGCSTDLPWWLTPFRAVLSGVVRRLADRLVVVERAYVCDSEEFAREEARYEESRGRRSFVVEVEDHSVGVVAWSSDQMRRLESLESVLNRIAVYLRERYWREIERGEHDGMSLDQVVIRYLSRERAARLEEDDVG